ncbi:MAG: rhomboid family intramembrane serine protease [Jatrophihabitans sp.]
MNQPLNQSQGLAHCYRHPNRETGVRCIRCERPICSDCMRPASVGFHCPDDVREGARTVHAQRTSVGARILHSPPYVTITLVVLNVAAYLVTGLQKPGTLRQPVGSQLFQDWQELPQTIHDQDRYYTLLTSAFLHLSLLHIAANMLALAIVGPVLERLLGWWRFLSVYLVCALGGSALIYVFENRFTPTAGASGAIFGLFGVGLVLVRKLGVDPQWLVGTVVLNFVITFSVPGISKLGHIGGFVVGVLAGLAIGGLPNSRQRVRTAVQTGGLGVLLALVVIVVGVRSATFPT